jgi:hypothetical protein
MPDGASIDVHLGYLNPSDRIGGTVATRIKLLGKDGYQVAITPAVVGAYPLAGRESKLFGYAIAGINVAQFERHSYGMFGPVGGLGLLWIPMTLVIVHLGASVEYSHHFSRENGAFFTAQAGITLPTILIFGSLGRIR